MREDLDTDCTTSIMALYLHFDMLTTNDDQNIATHPP